MHHHNHQSKTLFSSQFKPIEFVKSNDDSKAKGVGEEVKHFYDDLVNQDSSFSAPTQRTDEPVVKATKKKDNKLAKTSSSSLGDKQFLAAVQNGQLNTISDFFGHCSLRQALDLLAATDQYSWNCFMISAAAAAPNQVLAFLFDFFVDRMTRSSSSEAKELMELFIKLTAESKDGSGSDLEKIAAKVKNTKAVQLLRSTRQKLDSLFLASQVKKEAADDDDSAAAKESYVCPACGGQRFDEPEGQHVTSIVHLLNVDKSQVNRTTNYFLRSSNIGYQLLCKQGWNEQRGLGAQEQGKIYPIKATVKLDRLGIGVAPSTSSSKLVLQPTKKPVRLKRAACQRGDAVLMRTIKAEAQRPKRIEKEKAFAKNFRLYCNQD